MEMMLPRALAMKKDVRLRNNTEFARKLLLEKYGRHSDNHPAAGFLRKMLKRINGKAKVDLILTKDWNDMNAAALPDGSIFFSSKLFQFCEFQEELEFILRHEYEHILQRHSEKIDQQEGNEALWRKILTQVGASRVAEYESDIRALIRSDEEDVNPYGAIVAAQRFADAEAGGESDIIHGSPLIRLLNMQYVTRLIDMPTLSRDLTPITPELIEALGVPKRDLVTFFSYDYRELTNLQKQRISATRSNGEYSTLTDLVELYRRTIDTLDRFKDLSIVKKTQVECDTEVMKVLVKKIKNKVDAVFPDLDAADKKIMLPLVLELAVGCEVTKYACKGVDPLGIGNPLISYAKKNPSKLASLIQELEKHKDNFYFQGDPSSFLKNIVEQQGYNEETEFKLVRIKGCLQRIYDSRGLENVDWSSGHTAIAKYVLNGIEKKEDINLFLALCEAAELKLSNKSRREIFDIFVKRLRLNENEVVVLSHDEFFAGSVASNLPKEILDKIGKIIFDKDLCPFKIGKEIEPKFHGQDMKDALQRYCEAIVKESEVDSAAELIEMLYFYKESALCMQHLFEKRSTSTLFENKIMEIEKDRFFMEISEFLFFNAKNMPWKSEPKVDRCSRLVERRLIGYLSLPLLEWDEIEQMATLVKHEDEVRADVLSYLILKKAQNTKPSDRNEFFSNLKRFTKYAEEIKDSNACVIIYQIFSHFSYDLSNNEHLDQFFDVSQFIYQYDLRMRIQKMILERFTMQLPKDEAKSLLFEDNRTTAPEHFDIKENFIEREVTNPIEIQTIYRKVLEGLVPSDKIHRKAGELILQEQGLSILAKDKIALLKLLLSTEQRGDTLIRKLYASCEKRCGELSKAEFSIARLYNLDLTARYALIQTLLVGENGALLNTENRKNLLEWFFEEFIERPTDEENKIVYEVLREIFSCVAEKADVSSLYFMVAPLMVERILKKPKKPITIYNLIKNDKKLEREEKKELLKEFKDDEHRHYCEDLVKYIDAKDESNKQKEISPVAFVKELASILGAPGVRFLQNLGLYIQIPDSLQEEFNEVYDSMKGQNKLSAFHSLKRQWPEIMTEDVSIGVRVGGGSLFTVYEATVDGKKEVIKVANPNAEFHTENTCKVLKEVFESNPKFAAAAPLLDDIGQWLIEDVSFAGSVQQEAAFHSQNHGWTVEGNDYSIYIPEAKLSENARFRREEFVEGTNLTQPSELFSQGHDLKEIVNLLVKNSVLQLQNGTMHSDIHPGNIRITQDKKVALLDRGYYIVLDEQDKKFLASIPMLISDKKKLTDAIASYIGEFEENKAIDKKQISENLAEALEKSNGSTSELIASMMVAIRKCGCKTPLKLTLALKNAVALDRIAKTAGFNNVFEAYFYK